MTRPTQQVEAMARAIYDEDIKVTTAAFGRFYAEPFEDTRQEYVAMALAALRALAACPPSRDVGLAANVIPITRTISKDDKGEIDFFVTRYEAEDILTAMLSAAVKEAEDNE